MDNVLAAVTFAASALAVRGPRCSAIDRADQGSPGVERSLSANGLVVQAGTEPRVVAIAKCFEGGAAVAGVGRAVHRGDRPRSELSKAADP